jgi:hypothetical protein
MHSPYTLSMNDVATNINYVNVSPAISSHTHLYLTNETTNKRTNQATSHVNNFLEGESEG